MRETGLEPVRCEPHAPQTCASASSATPAYHALLCATYILYTFFGKCQDLFQKNLKKNKKSFSNAFCFSQLNVCRVSLERYKIGYNKKKQKKEKKLFQKLLTNKKKYGIILSVPTRNKTTYAGMAELADALDSGSDTLVKGS